MTTIPSPPSPPINAAGQQDVWLKWHWAWDALYFVVLAGSTLLGLNDELTIDERRLLLLLVAVAVVWHLGLMVWKARLDGELHSQLLIPLVYSVGLAVIWFTLTLLTPAFFFLLFGLFGQIFLLLPLRWSIPTVSAFALLAAYRQATLAGQNITLTSPLLWLYFAMTGLAVFFAMWINAIINQSSRRQALIEQLKATQAELAQAERNAGTLAERQRLAREIHDTLAQGFTSIVMQLEAADQALALEEEKARHHLDQARHTARESLEQARRVVQDLRPELLEHSDLAQAITQTAGRWATASGTPARVTITGQPTPLHPEIEVTALRAVQEALSNVRQHARASQVNITLSYMPDLLVLDVQDDGVGMKKAAATGHSGFGLHGMLERVEQLHGSLLIESNPGEGTTLVVEIPLNSTS